MKRITAKNYAQLLYVMVQGKSQTEIKTEIKKFLQLLIKKRDFSSRERIIDEFNKHWQEQTGEFEASVTAAKPLEAVEKKNLVEILAQRLGKKILIKEQIDHRLIGGFKIKIEDILIDGSIKGRLNRLKSKIVNGS